MRRLVAMVIAAACLSLASGGAPAQNAPENAPQQGHKHGGPAKGGKAKVAPECVGPDAPPSLRCAQTPTPFFDSRGNLWVAWTQKEHVYVANSGDGGKTFSAPVQITKTPYPIEKNGENRPKVIVAANEKIYVTFAVKGEQRFTGLVYFSRSLDGGKTFSEPANISDEEKPTSQRFETIQVDAKGRIHIAWIDKRDLISAKRAKKKYTGAAIYYTYSDDHGKNFSRNVKVLDHSCECCRVAMAVYGSGSPVVAWRHIFGKNIRDHAVAKIRADGSPYPATRLSEDLWALDGCPHHGPAISINNKGVQHITWFTQGKARQGLFHARSEDGGKTFSEPFGFGNGENQASHPYVLAAGERVFLTWKEFNGETSDIFFMESPDGGRSWSAPLRVSETANASDHPFLIQDGRWAYVSWATTDEGWRLFRTASIGRATR